jgi:hypothetical protein
VLEEDPAIQQGGEHALISQPARHLDRLVDQRPRLALGVDPVQLLGDCPQ